MIYNRFNFLTVEDELEGFSIHHLAGCHPGTGEGAEFGDDTGYVLGPAAGQNERITGQDGGKFGGISYLGDTFVMVLDKTAALLRGGQEFPHDLLPVVVLNVHHAFMICFRIASVHKRVAVVNQSDQEHGAGLPFPLGPEGATEFCDLGDGTEALDVLFST